MRNSFNKPGAKYISDYIPEIIAELYERKRFILQSQPGTGKTTAVISPKFESIAKILRQQTGLPVCMFVPLNLIIKQQEQGTGLPIITGATSPQDAAAAINSGIFLANFASVGKVLGSTGNDIIPIIDEIHLLPSAAYMEGERKTLSILFKLFKDAPYSLGLSGTPQSLFNAIGAPIVPAKCEIKQAVNLEVISSDKDSNVTALEHLLSLDNQSLSVVRVNDTILSSGMADQLTEKGNISGRIIHINSDSTGPDREHLEHEQEIKSDVGLAFVTCWADVGNDVNNKKVHPVISETNKEAISPEEIAQFLKRFRKVDNVEAKLFLKKKTVKPEDIFTHDDALELIEFERMHNHAFAQMMNYTKDPKRKDHIISAFAKPADQDRIIEVNGRYQANELWLLREALRLRDKGLSTDERIEILHEYLEGLSVSERAVDRGTIETEAKAELKEHKKEARIAAAITAGTVHQLIVSDYLSVIDSAMHSSHESLKRGAKKCLKAFGHPIGSVQPNPEILEFLDNARPKDLKPLHRFMSMTTGSEKHSAATVISILNASSNQWHRDANKAIELQYLKAEFSEKPEYWINLAEEKQAFIDSLEGRPYYDRETINEILFSLEDLRLIHYTSESKIGTLPKRQEHRGKLIRAFSKKVNNANRYSEFFTTEDLTKIYISVFGKSQIDLAPRRSVDLFKRVFEYRSRIETKATDSKQPGTGRKKVHRAELFSPIRARDFSLFSLNAKISVPLDTPEKRPVSAGIAENGVLFDGG